MSASIGLPRGDVPDTGWIIFLVATIFPVVNLVLLTFRISWRTRKDSLGRDDILITISFLCSIVLTALMDLSIAHGYGIHQWDLERSERRHAMKYFYFAQIFYKLVNMFNKVSILALYLRIFSLSNPVRRGSKLLISVVVLWSVASILMTILQCVPIKASWDDRVSNASCLNDTAIWYQYAVINITTDIMILLLPVRDVLRLQTRIKQKLGLLAMFSLGTVVCAISVARVVAISNSTDNRADITGSFTARSSLTLAEAHAGISCACLITLRGVFRYGFGSLRSRSGTASHTVPREPLRKGFASPTFTELRTIATTSDSTISLDESDLDHKPACIFKPELAHIYDKNPDEQPQIVCSLGGLPGHGTNCTSVSVLRHGSHDQGVDLEKAEVNE